LRALPSFKEKDYERALIDVYLKMDSMIQTTYGKSKLQGYYAKGKGNTSDFDDGSTEQLASGTGCTACSALITPTEIYVANAGDSRAVIGKKVGDKYIS
jgi:serine/threonine protein phosphatase PrpC